MRTVWVPVLLSALVWPGAGQLYNREVRKGIILGALTFLLCLSFTMGAELQILDRLPPEALSANWVQTHWAQVRSVMDDVLKQKSSYVMTFNLLMFAAWLFSVVDAYLTAQERRKAPPAPPAA